MSSATDETEITGYPELEPEADGVETDNADERPVSSRRNKLDTACRRSFTGTSLRFPIEFSSAAYAVVTAWLSRPDDVFCQEKTLSRHDSQES
jgi:hypothetical protein